MAVMTQGLGVTQRLAGETPQRWQKRRSIMKGVVRHYALLSCFFPREVVVASLYHPQS